MIDLEELQFLLEMQEILKRSENDVFPFDTECLTKNNTWKIDQCVIYDIHDHLYPDDRKRVIKSLNSDGSIKKYWGSDEESYKVFARLDDKHRIYIEIVVDEIFRIVIRHGRIILKEELPEPVVPAFEDPKAKKKTNKKFEQISSGI